MVGKEDRGGGLHIGTHTKGKQVIQLEFGSSTFEKEERKVRKK